MSMSRKGGASIDKGKAFTKAVAGSFLSQKSGSTAGKALTSRNKSGMVEKAFETASRRTGAFESRNANK